MVREDAVPPKLTCLNDRHTTFLDIYPGASKKEAHLPFSIFENEKGRLSLSKGSTRGVKVANQVLLA